MLVWAGRTLKLLDDLVHDQVHQLVVPLQNASNCTRSVTSPALVDLPSQAPTEPFGTRRPTFPSAHELDFDALVHIVREVQDPIALLLLSSGSTAAVSASSSAR